MAESGKCWDVPAPGGEGVGGGRRDPGVQA